MKRKSDKPILLTGFIIILILLLCLFKAAFADAADFHNVELVRVYDGDTIKVNIPNLPAIFGDNLGIRINNIDTPEIRGKCQQEKDLALKAKHRVMELLNGKQVNLTGCERGKYFRLVCNVNGLDDILVSEGLAVEYHGDTKMKDWCK